MVMGRWQAAGRRTRQGQQGRMVVGKAGWRRQGAEAAGRVGNCIPAPTNSKQNETNVCICPTTKIVTNNHQNAITKTICPQN